jgi:hypothetical protein
MCMHAPDAQIAPVFPDSSTWSSKMALEVAGDEEFAEVVAVQASVDSVGSEDDLDVGSEDEVEVEQQHEAACDGDAPLELEVLVLEDEAASEPSSGAHLVVEEVCVGIEPRVRNGGDTVADRSVTGGVTSGGSCPPFDLRA